MHFVYGFCDGNARAAVDEYQRRFPDRRIPSGGIFSCIHQTMRETGCLPSVAVQSERGVVPLIYTEGIFLRWFREVHDCLLVELPLASACHVCRCDELYMRNIYVHSYHDHRIQHLEPGDPARRTDFCHWITAHPQLLSVILFTDEASFTRDG